MDTLLVSEATGVKEALPIHVPLSQPRYSLSQRMRSCFHGFWYRLSEGLQWSRGVYHEQPAGYLSHLSGNQLVRIAVLQRRFHVRFERQFSLPMALKNYEYLDVLDQAWAVWGKPRPVGGIVHDVGSSNFWYARTLSAFFTPAALTGIEIEGYRIYRNGYSRWDYAQGYVAELPRTSFKVADYAQYHDSADTIVAWCPFVTPSPVLAWRMPLHVLAPHALFARIAANLNSFGLFVMVNQGQEEADIACDLCWKAGLQFEGSCEVWSTVRHRRTSLVVSWWRPR